jgi:hypothetical protein
MTLFIAVPMQEQHFLGFLCFKTKHVHDFMGTVTDRTGVKNKEKTGKERLNFLRLKEF